MNNLIDNIINLEWNEFQNVKNEGGRASCQDDWRTFEIARRSQYLSWNAEMLESYHDDLLSSKKEGRNLLTEKYARMMESTAPEQYDKIEGNLPIISLEKKWMIEEIIAARMKWAEEFAKKYPLVSENGRPIHSYEDDYNNTSIETYERGELGTYSEKTVRLYYEYVKKLQSQGINLSEIIMENTARSYGYQSIEEAEKKMRK